METKDTISQARFLNISDALKEEGFDVFTSEEENQLQIVVVTPGHDIVATVVFRPGQGLGLSFDLAAFGMEVADICGLVSRYGSILILEPFFYDGMSIIHGDEAWEEYQRSLDSRLH